MKGLKAVRRLVQKDWEACAALRTCPDFLELENGDFALIGEDVTGQAEAILLPGSGVGAGERLIRVPRSLIISAKQHIPDA